MPSACFRIKCKRQSYQGKNGTKHENFIFCRSFEYLEEVGSTIPLHGLKYLFSHYCRSAPTLVSGGTKLKSGINAQERHKPLKKIRGMLEARHFYVTLKREQMLQEDLELSGVVFVC